MESDEVEEMLEKLKRRRQALDDAIAALEQIARTRHPEYRPPNPKKKDAGKQE